MCLQWEMIRSNKTAAVFSKYRPEYLADGISIFLFVAWLQKFFPEWIFNFQLEND